MTHHLLLEENRLDGHVLVTGPSGSGRTTALQSLAAQALAGGAICTAMDPYRLGPGWPDGVERCESPDEIHAELLRVEQRLDDLDVLADRYQTDSPAGDAMHVVVIDDLAHILHLLDSDTDAARAFERVLACGRAAGVHLFMATGRRPRGWIADQVATHITTGRDLT